MQKSKVTIEELEKEVPQILKKRHGKVLPIVKKEERK